MRHPRHTAGSDGILVGGKPHPRAWGPSRATSVTTAASWGCSPWRSASGTSPGGRRSGWGCATAAWSAPDTPPTWFVRPGRSRRHRHLRPAAQPRCRHPLRAGERRARDGRQPPDADHLGRALRRAATGRSGEVKPEQGERAMSGLAVLETLRADRALTVVRAETIPDAVDLCHALAEGGLRTVELTFTTPGRAGTPGQGRHGARGAARRGHRTHRRAGQGRRGCRGEVPGHPGATAGGRRGGHRRGGTGVPRRVHPHRGGPGARPGLGRREDLPGPAGWAPVPQGPARPLPRIGLLPSGGVSADNAAAFLDAGALAVCAGTSVVPPAAVAAGRWAEITERAREFAAALSSSREN